MWSQTAFSKHVRLLQSGYVTTSVQCIAGSRTSHRIRSLRIAMYKERMYDVIFCRPPEAHGSLLLRVDLMQLIFGHVIRRSGATDERSGRSRQKYRATTAGGRKDQLMNQHNISRVPETRCRPPGWVVGASTAWQDCIWLVVAVLAV